MLSSSDSSSSISQFVYASSPLMHHCIIINRFKPNLVFISKKKLHHGFEKLTAYPEMTGPYGTAYADNRGSEKYSSDFGWSATTYQKKERRSKSNTGSYPHKQLHKTGLFFWVGEL